MGIDSNSDRINVGRSFTEGKRTCQKVFKSSTQEFKRCIAPIEPIRPKVAMGNIYRPGSFITLERALKHAPKHGV